jgi:hypothetical protein
MGPREYFAGQLQERIIVKQGCWGQTMRIGIVAAKPKTQKQAQRYFVGNPSN